MLWDGNHFFGFDERKIHRINNKPPRWTDMFKNRRYIFASVIVFIVTALLVVKETDRIGEVK